MSLARDYHHYYVGTWIGLLENDILVPIFVEAVTDESGMDPDDFSEEHRSQLQLHGYRYDKRPNGRISGSRIAVPVLSTSLVLESPDVGYVCTGRDIRWTVIRPVRQRTKGIISNKINGTNLGRSSDSASIVYNLFNPSFDGMITRYMFVSNRNNRIYYKGAEVGEIRDGSILILSQFSYLTPQIIGCEQYANLPVTSVGSL